MAINPYKMKDDTWGIGVRPAEDLEEGEVVTVEAKNFSYRAVVKHRVFKADDGGLAIYRVERLPRVKDDVCPMCGARIDKSLNKKRESAPYNMPQRQQELNSDPDDDIPF